MFSKTKIITIALLSFWIFSFGLLLPKEASSREPAFPPPKHSLRPGQDFVAGEVLVKRGIIRKRVKRLKIPKGKTLQGFLQDLQKSPFVEYAEPNYIAHSLFVPNDPYYSPYQWNLKQINMPQAWDISKGEGAIVAVVDTGIKKVGDLQQTDFTAGFDFVNNDNNPSDENGHGTHVAGTIAQSTNNAYGAAGIAFKARLMPVRVLNRNGSGNYADIAEGIRWAADHGAKVINLSLGARFASRTLKEAVRYAYQKGATVVAASGNDGDVSSNGVYYPAAYGQYVIAVGAVRYDQKRADYSNGGDSLDVVAPGGDLNEDQNHDGYGDGILQQTFKERRPGRVGFYFYQGTSMAAAHVSGVAALLAAQGVSGLDAIKGRLESSALDLGPSGWDKEYGYGLIDAAAVLGASTNVTPVPTIVVPTSTPTLVPTPTSTPTPIPTSTPLPSATPTLAEPTAAPTGRLKRRSPRFNWRDFICRRYPWWHGCR